jgi:hypothetical protein
MAIQDSNGQEITVDRLIGVTWSLLEDARASPEVDHAACGKYIEIIAKVLLPRSDGGGGAKAESLRSLLETMRADG